MINPQEVKKRDRN